MEITKIVKRELSPVNSWLDLKNQDSSTSEFINSPKRPKQKNKHREKKKNKNNESDATSRKESRTAIAVNKPIAQAGTAVTRVSPFSEEERAPSIHVKSSHIETNFAGMPLSISRSHDQDEQTNVSKTILKVKMKVSRKDQEPEASEEKKEEKPRHCPDEAKNKKSSCTFLDLPTDERVRRRLSDSAELTERSPPRVRRRSVSFDPLTVLKTAILENDVEIVNNILVTGKVNANTTLDGVFPVVLAAKDGCAECLEVLIEKGAHIDVTGKHGLSPLEIAVREGHFDCAQLLISAGANANSIRDGYFDESIEHTNRATCRSRSKTF